MHFVKVHAAGNDFVLLPDLEGRLHLDAAAVAALCDRHRGLGGDGVLRLAPPSPGTGADVFMDYRNADGSVAEMCGNGIRSVAKYVVDRGIVDDDRVLVETRSGVRSVLTRRGGDGLVARATVDMDRPEPGKVDLGVEVDGEQLQVTTVSMGNPHCVTVVADVRAAPLQRLGLALQGHELFPEGVNVEVIRPLGSNRLEGRIFERGIGETLASGSGVSAMAVAAHLLGLADRVVTVAVPGGELEVDWSDEAHVLVTGPAVEVATGELDAAFVRRLPGQV